MLVGLAHAFFGISLTRLIRCYRVSYSRDASAERELRGLLPYNLVNNHGQKTQKD